MKQETAIAMFCYKRADKMITCIEALLTNPECATMDIVFFCDGHKNDHDLPGVLATRSYIDRLTGFKNIYRHYREKNVSTGPNFFQGLSHMCENYSQFIVVEDDLVVTSNYIKYMLDALDFYKAEQSIFCITGYCFPLKRHGYPFDTVIYYRFCSYGWACWSEKMKQVIWDNELLNDLLKKAPGFKNHLNKTGMDLSRMLRKQVKGTISTWDIQMQVHVALNRMKVVYPIISKTSNIGFGADSTNTFGIDYLKTITDNGEQRIFRFCSPTVVAPGIQRQLKEPYGLPALFRRKIINTLISMKGKVRAAFSL